MSSAAGASSSARSEPHAPEYAGAPTRALTVEEIAWLAVIPTALVVLAAIAVLGPPLGRWMLPPDAVAYWPSWAPNFHPEPAEQGRFLLSLGAPLLLAALTIAGARRPPRLAPATIASLVLGVQLAGVAFVVACVVAQWQFTFGETYSQEPLLTFHRTYFSHVTLIVAALATACVVAAARSATVRERIAAATRESRGRAAAAAALAVAAIVVWLLHAAYTDVTLTPATVNAGVFFHAQFTLDETFAVLNGRTPLVDFAAQYGSLFPFAFAAAMLVLGDSVGVWVTLALIATGLSMLALYAVLRRVARSSLAGLLLFLPVLASSFFLRDGTLADRWTAANYFGSFPLRYAGPFVLAWLVARHLDGARPRQPWLVFLAAGVVVLNNADAGVPAVGATVAALLWAGGRPTGTSLARLALGLVAGLLAAFALVAVLTLLRTGSLPDLGLLVRFSRLFAAAGFGLMPMPTLGMHTVVYLTFVAAIGVATVRTLTTGSDRLLTGMLAWSGVFGLGAGVYYVGRSHPDNLIAIFPMWAFALALLVVVALRGLAADPRRIPSLATLACLFGFAVAACTLAQTPAPWTQLDRLARTAPPALAEPYGQTFVAHYARPGDAAAILILMGHRIGENLDVTNVSPYTGSYAMPTREQLEETVAALREAGGRMVFFSTEDTMPEVSAALRADGFRRGAIDVQAGFEMWIDRRINP